MAAAASQSLQTAFDCHRVGDWGRAESICRDLLRIDPRHSDALHLLGVVAFQRNEKISAVDYLGQAIDADRGRPEYHNSLGNVYRTLGRPVDAIAEFREALRLKPDFSVAYNNLGIVLADCGQDRGAIACFEQAVQLDQRNAQAWMNLGSALIDLGEAADAAACYECAIELEPNQGRAFEQLGRCRARLNRLDEAIIAYERAVELRGDAAPASLLKELAAGYLQTKRSALAEVAYRRAIAGSPDDANLLLNLAQALKDQQKHAESIDWYRRGIALDPQNAVAHYTLGRALHLSERFEEAISSYQKSLALGAQDAKAAYHLGNACKSLKRLNEAVEAYLKALQWDPEFVPALYQLGNAYRQLHDLDGARMCLEKVLRLKPDDLTSLVCLGNVLRTQDDLVGASVAFKKVIGRVPDKPLWELWLDTLCPIVFHSAVGIDQYRARLQAKVNALAELKISITPEEITDRGCPPPYHLQFHGRNDRALKEAYAQIFANCRGNVAPPVDAAGASHEKPRIGFVVTDGHEGVFLRYLSGVIQRLDRECFEPVIICSAGGALRVRVEHVPETVQTFVIPSRFDKIVERVREGRFTVLYHWEVGSDTTNYFLPFFRLAPIQCTGAGLPETSGLSQIDYFLSNEACEPDGAERHYTERLIRSRSLLTWQQRMPAPAIPGTRADFGIEKHDHFYLCPHKIDKFHPDFDALLGGILRRDPRGVVVIPKDLHGHAARKLYNRLRLALPHVIDRIRFVPHQALSGYFRLIDAADVLLDPIHYGGGLTSFDGLSLNKPIVTLPGQFLRGRFTLGFYRTMGVTECIAETSEDYIEKAVRLGTDSDWRVHVSERIRDTSDVLFESADSVAQYDQIFQQLVDEAQRSK